MSDGDLGRQVWQMRKFLAFTIAAARRGGSQDACAFGRIWNCC
jgi:hypothetical protein